MITLERAKPHMLQYGIELPDAALYALVEKVNEIDACLTANYNDETVVLIQLYLLTLFGLSSQYRYVTSQRAPSGASRSFQYKDLQSTWRGILNMLRALDYEGCATPLIPVEPFDTPRAAFFVATGGCGMC